MNKEERFFYMKNAAQKSANMAEENHLELLGAMCDEKTRQCVIMMNTNDPGYMLFMLNTMLINQLVQNGLDYGMAVSVIMQAATAASNPQVYEHLWSMEEDK